MSKEKNRYFAWAICLVIIVSSLSATPIFAGSRGGNSFGFAPVRFTTQAGANWQSFGPNNEEFVFLVPVSPSAFEQFHRGYTFREPYGEKVISERSYSGYVGDFVFVVDSYQAKRPAKLLEDLLGWYYPKQLREFENTSINGLKVKKYQVSKTDIYHDIYYFITKNHLYVLMLAAKDKGNPFITHLLASFRLDENKSVSGTNNVSNLDPNDKQNLRASNASSDQVYPLKEVTRRPYIVWKPEPSYTERARQQQIMGSVMLDAILESSGQVRISNVVKGLGNGLTEQAIEAAKNMRFLPAEKDGKNVSVQIKMEYNFNLY